MSEPEKLLLVTHWKHPGAVALRQPGDRDHRAVMTSRPEQGPRLGIDGL